MSCCIVRRFVVEAGTETVFVFNIGQVVVNVLAPGQDTKAGETRVAVEECQATPSAQL